MTLYRGLFYKDKEREKSGPTKMCRYSEIDVIWSVVIEGFDCRLLREKTYYVYDQSKVQDPHPPITNCLI